MDAKQILNLEAVKLFQFLLSLGVGVRVLLHVPELFQLSFPPQKQIALITK